jgi:hypothetical protein
MEIFTTVALIVAAAIFGLAMIGYALKQFRRLKRGE